MSQYVAVLAIVRVCTCVRACVYACMCIFDRPVSAASSCSCVYMLFVYVCAHEAALYAGLCVYGPARI